RVRCLPELAIEECQVEVRSCVVRVHRDDLLVEGNGVGGYTEVCAHDREIEQSALHLRIQVERQAIEAVGGDEPILALRDLAEVVVGVLVFRILREGGEVGGSGLIELAGGVSREAAVQRISGGLVRAARPGPAAGGQGTGAQENAGDQSTLHSGAMVARHRSYL